MRLLLGLQSLLMANAGLWLMAGMVQAQNPPAFFVVHGNIGNGDQFDPGFPYNFDTSTGGGSKSRTIPLDTIQWGSLSVSTSIGTASATATFQGSIDAVNASRACNIVYGCGWGPGGSTQYSGMDVYVLGNPGTTFHLVQTASGSLTASVTTTHACDGGFGNAQASASWAGTPSVTATSEHGTGGFCGIPAPKSGSAMVSENHVVDGTSTGPTMIYNGQTYSHAYSMGTSLSLGISADQDPDFTATSRGNVTVNITIGPGPGPTISVAPSPLGFGTVALNQTKTERFIIKNTGPAGSTLNGTVAQPLSPFTIQSGCTSFSLLSGQSCPVNAAYSPSVAGQDTGAIDISSNDQNTPTYSLPLMGKAGCNTNFDVSGLIIPRQQPSPTSCWATAASMMVTWHTRTFQTEMVVASLADSAPPPVTTFVQRLQNPPDQQGLSLYQVTSFLTRLGLSGSGAVLGTPSVCDIANLLQTYGPLWVTTGGEGLPPSPHAQVVVGIHGDGTPAGTSLSVIDPGTKSINTVGYVNLIGIILSVTQWPQWAHF